MLLAIVLSPLAVKRSIFAALEDCPAAHLPHIWERGLRPIAHFDARRQHSVFDVFSREAPTTHLLGWCVRRTRAVRLSACRRRQIPTASLRRATWINVAILPLLCAADARAARFHSGSPLPNYPRSRFVDRQGRYLKWFFVASCSQIPLACRRKNRWTMTGVITKSK